MIIIEIIINKIKYYLLYIQYDISQGIYEDLIFARI